MKYLYYILGGLLGLAVILFGLQMLASERVEVIELHTLDTAGAEVTTRLWIVDDAGFPYLRVGAGGSAWLERLQAHSEFEVTRNGNRAHYTAAPRPDKRDRINQLMHEKYTWGDTIIGLMVGTRDNALPVELHRVD